MKKRKTTAILIASTLMLSIVGCNGAPSASGSSEMEMTEAELREAAREAMIATEDSSTASSNVEAATSASSEASAAASSSDAASVDTSATTAASNTTPDAATASSAGANATSTASGTDKPFKLEEHNFVYNGVTSVMEDTSAIMSKLGKYDKKETPCTGMASYRYGSGDVYLITGVCGNQEIPIDVAIYRQGIRTIRNVGVGSSLSDVINAYSDCTRNSFSLGKDYGEIISLGSSCSIYFYFSSKTDRVAYYTFTNEDSLNKMHSVKADVKEKAKEIVEDKGKQASTSASTDSAANASSTPAPAPAPVANSTASSATAAQNTDGLAEYEIMINGKKVSILDDAATVQANLGKLEEKDTTKYGTSEEPRYSYLSGNIIFYTFVDNGNELTYDLCVYEKGAKTSRGVGVGDSKDAIVAAYGNPVETYEYYQGFGMKYKFDKFTLYFDFDSNTNKVTDIVYGNNDTITKRHAKHPDYIGD
ncbi:hypothetical protein [Butyrivibrio sp. M55]|uniref:hypothetical protein n=1 Tax=Butyrivibrio sp. M55 TaxID=1855323 RepID=UPI0008EBD031|nr:hypothetical protein [Butyrivibrio sp. M55]SFU69697.1 hypothetical protein SAMN05216540_10671 [Butyrivibrio sp. M55]